MKILCYCPAVLSALCVVVVVTGSDDGQCTMETKETCSEDSSAAKTSEDTEQKTVTIPTPKDTKTCTKDYCDNKDRSVKQDQPEGRIPVKDGESEGERKEETIDDSDTRGKERGKVFICLSQLK